MVNETNIRCFLTLAETLNFSETAKKLFISQQAVSKHIAQLEKDFGFKLFIRTHHYVMLTKSGESCYKIFADFRSVYEKTIEENRRINQELSMALHVGYPEMLDLVRRLHKSITLLKNEVPGIRYLADRYNKAELNENFLNRKLDMIITYDSLSPKAAGLRKTVLFESPILLYVSRDNPLVADAADYQTFKNEPLIYVPFGNLSEADLTKMIAKYILKFAISPCEIKIVPNLETAYTAVELGAGIMFSTEISKAAANEAFSKYSTGKKEPIVCVYREDEENPQVKKYLKILLQTIRD
jgi:DNA-binding transcriptional LysR family regulator